MRSVYLVRAALPVILIAVCASCGSRGIPQSSLLLRNATTSAIISTAAVPGTVSLAVNQTLPVQVIRTFKNDNGNTETSDVTAFATFLLTNATGIATIDAYGNITATGAGTAQLLVKFRADPIDPYDTVRLTISVK